jgi:mono/diheme cytochrome c family protein
LTGYPIFNVEPPFMKKLITVLTFSAIIISCTHKAIPTASSTPAPTPAPVTTTVSTTETAPVGAAETASIDQGHAIYTTKCGKCHGLKNPADFTPTRWDGILKVMAAKAKLNDVETAQVAAYVKANAKPVNP